MKQTPKYVGLDVHQATTVTVVQDERGRVIARPTRSEANLGGGAVPERSAGSAPTL